VNAFRYILPFGLVFLFACNSPSPKKDGVDQLIQSESGGGVRGIQIGDDWTVVRSREEQNVVYSMPDELICRVPLNMKDSTFYEISYNFGEDGLYIIDLNFFPSDEAQTQKLYKKFKTYYDSKYGKSSEDQHFTAWYTSSSREKDLEISMTDESKEKGKPFLNITFFEKDGIAP
jgi:hypothetical protein